MAAGAGAVMSAAAHRGPSGRSWRWVITVVLLGAVNLAWNLRADVAPFSFPADEDAVPLRLTQLQARLASDGKTLLVEMTVQNLKPRRQRGTVWWQLAPASPGVGGPAWPRRAYESRYLDVDVAGDGQATVRWAERPLVPRGTYAVHGWARYARGGSLHPSDGRPGTPTAIEVPGSVELLRHRPTTRRVAITRVDVGAAPTGAVDGRVAVRNLTDRAQHGWLSWTLLPLAERDLAYWWRWAPTPSPPRYREIDLAPRAEVIVDVNARTAGPDTYALRLTVELDDTAGRERGFVVDDEAATVVGLRVRPRAPSVAGQ